MLFKSHMKTTEQADPAASTNAGDEHVLEGEQVEALLQELTEDELAEPFGGMMARGKAGGCQAGGCVDDGGGCLGNACYQHAR